MKQILKYEVLVGHPLEIFIPSPSPDEFPFDCVYVDVLQEGQPDRVWIWLEVDVANPPRARRFVVYPTGAPIPDEAEYCGSVRHIASGLVWHVYEEPAS